MRVNFQHKPVVLDRRLPYVRRSLRKSLRTRNSQTRIPDQPNLIYEVSEIQKILQTGKRSKPPNSQRNRDENLHTSIEGSDMASVYEHLFGRDVDDALLRLNGVPVEEERHGETFSVTVCPRCISKNSPGSKFCITCG